MHPCELAKILYRHQTSLTLYTILDAVENGGTNYAQIANQIGYSRHLVRNAITRSHFFQVHQTRVTLTPEGIKTLTAIRHQLDSRAS